MSALLSPAKLAIGCLVACLSFSVAQARTPTAELQKIESLLQAGDFATAKAAIRRLEQQNPNDPELLFLKGLSFAQSGDTDNAIRVFYQITQDYPELPEPYNNLAVLYAKKQQYNKARAALRAAISTHPAYSTAHTNLGDIYAILASIAYKRAIDQNGGDEQSLVKLKMLTQITTVDPNDVNAAVLEQSPTTDFSPDGSGSVTYKPAASRPLAAAQPRVQAVAQPAPQPKVQPQSQVAVQQVAAQPAAPLVLPHLQPSAAAQPRATESVPAPTPTLTQPRTIGGAPTKAPRASAAVSTPPATRNPRAIHVYPTGQKAPSRFAVNDVPVVRDPATHMPTAPSNVAIQSDLPRRLKLPKIRSEVERRSAVEKHLVAWAGAWSRGQAQQYFDAYGEKMKSTKGGSWQQQRRQELSLRNNRRVSLRRPVIEFLSSDLAIVNLELDYRSTGQKYRAQVLVMLENTNSGWKIIREEVLKKNG